MELHQTHVGAVGSMSQERAVFVQKVYGLLTLSLFTAFGGAMLGTQLAPVFYLPVTIVGFIAMFAAMYFRKVRGLNLALLFGFTFLDGMASGPALAMIAGSGHGVLISRALLMTATSFVALTIYVFWSQKDFSYLAGFLWTALMGLVVVSLGAMFFGMGKGMTTIYCYVGILVFVGYVLFDTSRLIHNTPTDEYVGATITLFLDILNLFWFILRLFLNQRDD